MHSRAWGWLAIVISPVCLLAAHAFGDCTPSNETTKWGGNDDVVMQVHKPMRQVRGAVLQDYRTGKPWPGVLVEVYNHPEVVLRDSSRNRTGQTRILGCVTDQRGRFSFKLKAGDYELRASNGGQWNVTSVVVRVRRGRFISLHHLVVQLFPGS
ncbi:MAG TPA: carboxypeptidase regulatory-like domain-containing protein [Terriglobales bacterium]